MSATTNPELLIMPLARDGEKNTLPETTGATTGEFSQQYGFQQINSTPLIAGGKAPDRKDMNGAFNLLGGVAYYAQKGWTFHYDASQDYYLGCVVIDPADGNRYECIADMAAGTVAPHEDNDGDYWRRFTLGDGEAVGVIKAFAGNGDIPSGYLLCDGAAVSRTMFPDLFAAIGTIYGSGDGSTTFNLPDYNTAQRFVQGSTVAGTEKSAGLPNITGEVTKSLGNQPGGTGALRKTNETSNIVASGNNYWFETIHIDASLSNPIYGNSDTVQPPALTCRYIIKAFDGQNADSALIDITQYAQELAGKANITGSNLVHHRDVINTSGTYTAPVTGLYKITVKGGGGGGGSGYYISGQSSNAGGGGGEGGTTISHEKMTAGDTATVVIGAGGAGGAAGANNGVAGGNSSVVINSNTYTGSGGGGGSFANVGGVGGSGTINGAAGGTSSRSVAGNTAVGGNGGGNGGGTGSSGAGNSGTQGSGGGGGGVYNVSTAGGAGGDGFVWFEYVSSGV